MTTMNNEDPADPSVHEPRELPEPVAWAQPDHLQKARLAPFLCRVEPTQRHADFVPLYTADQMRDAIATEREHCSELLQVADHIRAGLEAQIAALREQESDHRSAQAAVYAALGPYADPDRATWPDQIRAMRERHTDTADQMREAIATERERRCPGIPDPHCNYLATCCTICNKCGRQHAGSIPPTWVTRPTRSEALAAAGFTRRPSLKAMEMRAALELIAAPMRPDGTWNRDREACRELAAEALGRYDDSKTHNVRANRPARGPRSTDGN